MQRQTKIIIASIVGAIIIIPIVLFLLAVMIAAFWTPRSAATSSLPPMMATGGVVRSSFDNDASSAIMMEQKFAASDFETSAPETAGDTAATVDQKIIKTGYLDLTVDAVDETVVKITALVSGKGGYLQNSSVYEKENGTKYGSVVVRIPATEFENAMTESKKMATAINTESASGQDVTEEYTDLEAQLRNAQAQEAEYLEILKKAVTVDDILNVQSYLGQVRGQIESFQGRIKYLSNLTSYSTVTIYLSEEPSINVPTKEFRPWTSIKEAAQTLIAVAQTLVITLIWLVVLGGGIFLPLILIFVVLVIIIKKIWRRMISKK